MSYDALRETFFTECEDLLDAVATGLAEMADGSSTAETVNAVFRAVHSIKGAAGAFELSALVSFAHRFETVLDAARGGRLSIDGPALATMSRAGDVLADLVEAARAGGEVEGDAVAGALSALDALLGEPEEAAPATDFVFAPLMLEPVALDLPRSQRIEVAFSPQAGFYDNGHDPANYLQALAELGTIEVSCDLSRLPPLHSFDPEQSYLSWTVLLETEGSLLEVEAVFAFAEGLCDLTVRPLIEDLPIQESPAPLDEAPPDQAPPDPSPPAARPVKPDTEASLLAAAKSRAEVLAGWLEEQRTAPALLGSDPAMAGYLSRMAGALDRGAVAGMLLPTADREAEQSARNPPGDLSPSDRAMDSYLRKIVEYRGFGDLFLVTSDGDLIYSATGGTEPPVNVLTGRHGQFALAEAVREALSLVPGEVAMTDFEGYTPLAGEAAAFMAVPVTAGEESVGVLAVRITAEDIASVLGPQSDADETAGLYLVGLDRLNRVAVMGSGSPAVIDRIPDLPHLQSAADGQTVFHDNTIGLDGERAVALVQPIRTDGLDWTLVAERNRAEVLAPLATLRRNILFYTAVAVGFGALLSWAVSRTVALHLVQLALATRALSEKHYDVTFIGEGRRDEVGELAAALSEVRDEMVAAAAEAAERGRVKAEQDRVVSELGSALSRLAEGDLTRVIDVPLGAGYEALRNDVNSTMATLNVLLSSIVENASRISRKAQEISTSSEDLSRRTESQAATLEQTAAALDELPTSVKSSALGAAEVDEVVNKARAEAEASDGVVRDAVAAMSEIERSSSEIGQIIGVIDDIAFQTNLLALNAGVEAARAGEAGKGFAVVASEVRTLAKRSSDAAKQIKDLIGGSADHVQQGVDLVGRAGSALTSIVGRVAHISELVSDIATGAREQATGLSEINTDVNQLDQVTQQNAAMVEQSTAASHALNQEAKQLSEVVGRFRLRDPAFQSQAASAPIQRRLSSTDQTDWRPDNSDKVRLEATSGRPAFGLPWSDF